MDRCRICGIKNNLVYSMDEPIALLFSTFYDKPFENNKNLCEQCGINILYVEKCLENSEETEVEVCMTPILPIITLDDIKLTAPLAKKICDLGTPYRYIVNSSHWLNKHPTNGIKVDAFSGKEEHQSSKLLVLNGKKEKVLQPKKKKTGWRPKTITSQREHLVREAKKHLQLDLERKGIKKRELLQSSYNFKASSVPRVGCSYFTCPFCPILSKSYLAMNRHLLDDHDGEEKRNSNINTVRVDTDSLVAVAQDQKNTFFVYNKLTKSKELCHLYIANLSCGKDKYTLD